MSETSRKFTNKWKDHKQQDRTTTSKGINSMFVDCIFHVNPGATSMRVLAATQEQVSTTWDAVGSRCAPETYNHRVIFMGMMSDLGWEFLPQIFTTTLSEKTWIFDKWDNPENPDGNWDRKSLQMMATHTESSQPVFQSFSQVPCGCASLPSSTWPTWPNRRSTLQGETAQQA